MQERISILEHAGKELFFLVNSQNESIDILAHKVSGKYGIDFLRLMEYYQGYEPRMTSRNARNSGT